MYYNYGVSLPQSEHVDIFPVRLVSTFHRVFSVYLTLTVYLTYLSLSLRAELNTKVGSFLIKYKDSLHIHR
jgi:hypothetical protein